MGPTSFVIYKIEPTQRELDGEVSGNENSHGRLFLNTSLEIVDNTIIFKDYKDNSIQGVFPAEKYFVLRYDNR